MNFSIRGKDVVHLILSHLREQGYYEALNALALESNTTIGSLSAELLYLQKIVLQGRWSTVMQYLDEIEGDLGPDVIKKLTFIVQRQRFLELMSWQAGGEQRMAFPPWKPLSDLDKVIEPGTDEKLEMTVVLQHLNALKSMCSTAEFNSLCALLTVERLEDHSDYQLWTVAEGRWTCFSNLRAILAPLLPGDNTIEPVTAAVNGSSSTGLLRTIAMSLSYQTAVSEDIPLESSHGTHAATMHHDLGYIVPAALIAHHNANANANDDPTAPTVTITLPLRPLRSFEQVVPAPQVGYKVHAVATHSPARPHSSQLSAAAAGGGGGSAGATVVVSAAPRVSPSAISARQQAVHDAWAQEISTHTPAPIPEEGPRSSHRPRSASFGRVRQTEPAVQSPPRAAPTTAAGVPSPAYRQPPQEVPRAPSNEYYHAPPLAGALVEASAAGSRPVSVQGTRRGQGTFMTEPQGLSIDTGDGVRQGPHEYHDARSAPQSRVQNAPLSTGRSQAGGQDPAAAHHGVYDPRNLHESYDDPDGYPEVTLQHLRQPLASHDHHPPATGGQSHQPPPYNAPAASYYPEYQQQTYQPPPGQYLYQPALQQPQASPHVAQGYSGHPAPFPAMSGPGTGPSGQGLVGQQPSYQQYQASPHQANPQYFSEPPTQANQPSQPQYQQYQQQPQQLQSGYAQPLPTPNQQVVPLPPSQSGRSRPPPVAWTVEDPAPSQPPPETAKPSRPDNSVLAAAFTVGEVDENKVKPMPAALRKRMEEQQAAAAAAKVEQDGVNAAVAERAVSRGRSRSAPRGSATPAGVGSSAGGLSGAPPPLPVTVAGTGTGGAGAAAPASASRPQSAVRMRPAGSNIPAPSTAGGAGRRNSDAGSVQSERSGHGQGQPASGVIPAGVAPNTTNVAVPRNLSTAAPGSEMSVHSDATRTTATAKSQATSKAAASALHPEYAASVVFKSDFPLRCFNVLGVGAAVGGSSEVVRMAIGSNAKSIYTMSYNRPELVASRNLGMAPGPGPGVALQAELSNIHTGSVYCMDYHEGAGLLVSGSNDKAIRLSNPNNGQMSNTMKEHNGTIRTVRFLASSGVPGTANSLLFASAGGGDCKTRLWDAQAARVVRVLSEHPQSVYGLVWAGSDLLITGCDEGRVIGHDIRSAQPAWSYNLNDVLAQSRGETLRRGICCLTLLPTQQGGGGGQGSNLPIAAGCIGGFVTTFNAFTGQILSHDQLHGDDVRSICVMPAASRARLDSSFELLTASYDSTVAVWSAGYHPNGQIGYRKPGTTILRGHSDKALTAVPLAMPGRSQCDILSSGADGRAILWTLS